ncbi:MAG: hypothetical protein RI883_1887 [Bacteroidota bacterium]|jgi:PBP1b-binding outer membrane lipoprotein LpoB
MKIQTLLIISLILCSCSSSTDSETKEGPVTEETSKKIIQVQDANVELEKLEGDVDSLLNTLK